MIIPSTKQGFPGTHPGALDTSRDLLLGPRPRTPVIYWGPSQGSFSMALTAWSHTKKLQECAGGPSL